MAQLWIMPAAAAPSVSVRSGADRAVCGACPLRPKASGGCYVLPWRGPDAVYERAAALPRTPARDVAQTLAHLGLSVRLGAWGDPVALPPDVVLPLAARSTGYTHAWRLELAAPFRGALMASVASAEDRAAATALGWRTYRISSRPPGNDEIECPGQLPPGARRPRKTCAQCLACSGADRPGPDVVARPHGALRGRFYP